MLFRKPYVLLRLDSVLSEETAFYDYSIISVEHVLPQNPPNNSVWTKWFPSTEIREQYTHRLGNIVLLSRRKNSQARNYDFKQKKKKYFKSRDGISHFALTTQVLSEEEWTPDIIKSRQKKLIGNLTEIWHL